MSLGNNTDNSDLARRAVLYEAAIQVVVHHRPESQAVSFSEDLIAEREQAEANGWPRLISMAMLAAMPMMN